MAKNPLFWGKAGSGILFVSCDDYALLTLRSPWVNEPNKWGIPGGAVKGTEGHHYSEGKRKFKFSYQKAWRSAVMETEEEIGYFPKEYTPIGKIDFEEGSFVFVTFIVLVEKDEKQNLVEQARLDPHEASDVMWISMRRLMAYKSDPFLGRTLHFGVKFIIDELAKR